MMCCDSLQIIPHGVQARGRKQKATMSNKQNLRNVVEVLVVKLYVRQN